MPPIDSGRHCNTFCAGLMDSPPNGSKPVNKIVFMQIRYQKTERRATTLFFAVLQYACLFFASKEACEKVRYFSEKVLYAVGEFAQLGFHFLCALKRFRK